MTDVLDARISAALGALDLADVRARYREQDEFVHLPRALPHELVGELCDELETLRGRVHRNYVPGVRKGGNIGYSVIREHAPLMDAVYRSPAIIDYLSELAGKPLVKKSDADDHACALYVYTERGDGMRFHYDTCGCEIGASYTVIIGLIDRSSSEFRAELFRRSLSRRTVRLGIATRPGSMLLFCGSNVWHAVSRLGDGEERVVLSLSYVTPGKRAKGIWRVKENVKDALLYFGAPAVLQRNYFDKE